MAVKTIRYEDMALEDPVAIIGFPSVGLVSSITANYMVGQLDMTPIAGLSSPSMPPYCLIYKGVAYPPITATSATKSEFCRNASSAPEIVMRIMSGNAAVTGRNL